MIYSASTDGPWRSYLKTLRATTRGGDRIHRREAADPSGASAAYDAETPESDGALSAEFDWARFEKLFPRVDAVSGAPMDPTDLRRRRAEDRMAAARDAFSAGRRGAALAAATSAIILTPRDAGGAAIGPSAHFLRGALRLGSPETDEPTVIDTHGALADFDEAYTRAVALGADDAARICALGAAWSAFVSGDYSAALERAEAALDGATDAPARFLQAKSAAMLGDEARCEQALRRLIAQEPHAAALALADADLAQTKRARDAAFRSLADLAGRGWEALENVRRPASDALAGLKFEVNPDAAPQEFFEPTPFPGASAPVAAQIAALRLSRRALEASLAELKDAVANEGPADMMRRKALLARHREAKSQGRIATTAAAVFGGAIGFGAPLISAASVGVEVGQEQALILSAAATTVLGAGIGAAIAALISARSGRALRARDAYRAAVARAGRLDRAADALADAQRKLCRTAARPEFALLWPDAPAAPTPVAADAFEPTPPSAAEPVTRAATQAA